jgi:serine protease AprX
MPMCPPNPQPGIYCNASIVTAEGVTYGFSAGTSFAAPAVAGAAAAVRKWYNVTLKPGQNPSPSMTKAILVNGARDLTGARVLDGAFNPVGPPIKNLLFQPYNDYQGWGMLNLTRLLDAASNHVVYDAPILLHNGDAWAVTPLIVNGALDTRITIAWTDAPSSQGPHYNVVNNLDLLVCDNFSIKCFYANRFDSASHSLVTPPNPAFSDASNVVEEVVIPANTFATGQPLLVSVRATNVMMGTQDFALFSSNAH